MFFFEKVESCTDLGVQQKTIGTQSGKEFYRDKELNKQQEITSIMVELSWMLFTCF